MATLSSRVLSPLGSYGLVTLPPLEMRSLGRVSNIPDQTLSIAQQTTLSSNFHNLGQGGFPRVDGDNRDEHGNGNEGKSIEPRISPQLMHQFPSDIRGMIGHFWQGQRLTELPQIESFSIRYMPDSNSLGLYIGSIKDHDQLVHNMSGLLLYLYLTRELDEHKMMERYGNLLSSEQRDFDWTHEQFMRRQRRSRFKSSSEQDQEYYLESKLMNRGQLNNLKNFAQEMFPVINLLNEYEIINRQRHLPDLMDLPLFTQEGLVTFLTLVNATGANEDILGIRPLDFVLHYWDAYLINEPRGITVGELAVGLYKIKSHKFDDSEEFSNVVEVRANRFDSKVSLNITVEFQIY